jgi:hypothetical protein
MALVPSFLFDFESEMARITENEFARLIASDNLWWQEVTKTRPTGKKREIIAWLLSNQRIYDAGKTGGNIQFDDMYAVSTEYDVRNAAAGLELQKNQVTDNDGDGFDFAREWSANMGAFAAYWPQSLVATLILNGATATSGLAYDGLNFFVNGAGTLHPYNQFQTAFGGFANWFTGAAAGAYPGALPIDESIDTNTALLNLQKAIAYIATIKMPNGVTPRFLKPRRLLVAPRLVARAQQLTNAKFLAQPTTGGGGTGDVSAIISNWGFVQPIEVQEFAGQTTGDGKAADLVWYLACEQMTTTQLGGLVYVDREPFKVKYYTGDGGGTGQDAILDRARTLEWHIDGRNIAGYGHPYVLFRFDPS